MGIDQPPGYVYQRPPKTRPGRFWYVVALGFLAAGIAWLIYGLVSLAGTIDGMQRVSLPGGGTVRLTHSGGYTIYYEGQGARNGNIPFFHLNIAPASPGAAVSNLAHYGSEVTYDIGSHQGRAVLSLRVTSPGSFAVTTTGAAPANADLAFGTSISSGIVGSVVPAIPLIVLGFVAALVVLILRIIGRRSVRRAYAYASGP